MVTVIEWALSLLQLTMHFIPWLPFKRSCRRIVLRYQSNYWELWKYVQMHRESNSRNLRKFKKMLKRRDVADMKTEKNKLFQAHKKCEWNRRGKKWRKIWNSLRAEEKIKTKPIQTGKTVTHTHAHTKVHRYNIYYVARATKNIAP